jgi:hypothetical protein
MRMMDKYGKRIPGSEMFFFGVCSESMYEHDSYPLASLSLSSLLQTDAYERLWYLVVPPVMTLLDDFEARYKLLGIQVVNAVLEHAPIPLLIRTGISELILAV